MNKQSIAVLTLCALLALGAVAFLYNHYSNPKRVVLNRLENLGEVSSFQNSNPLDMVVAVREFQGYFTDPVKVDTKYQDIVGTHSMDEMKGLFLYSREAADSLVLEFNMPLVTEQGDDHITCRTDAHLTIEFKSGQVVTHRQTLLFFWRKEDKKWKIHKIEPYLSGS